MKILFTIPHYFRSLGGKAPDGRKHGSAALAQPRIDALTACVAAIRELPCAGCYQLDHAGKAARPVMSHEPAHIDVVICTTANDHLLDQVALPSGWWERRPTAAAPPCWGTSATPCCSSD
jgi:hypothetical protein